MTEMIDADFVLFLLTQFVTYRLVLNRHLILLDVYITNHKVHLIFSQIRNQISIFYHFGLNCADFYCSEYVQCVCVLLLSHKQNKM